MNFFKTTKFLYHELNWCQLDIAWLLLNTNSKVLFLNNKPTQILITNKTTKFFNNFNLRTNITTTKKSAFNPHENCCRKRDKHEEKTLRCNQKTQSNEKVRSFVLMLIRDESETRERERKINEIIVMKE